MNNAHAQQTTNKIASWLSTVFHPAVVGVGTAVFITHMSGEVATLALAVGWALGSLLLFFSLPFAFILRNVRKGTYRDMDVSTRENRHSMFLVTVLWWLAMLVLYHLIAAPRILIAFFGTCLLFVAVAAVINYRFTKISLHSLGLAGFVTMIFYDSLPLGIVCAFITILVGWARVQLQHHTITQVLIGWIVAVACVWLVFMLYLT